ncbi:MAG: putative pyridoxal-dependent aspartate 1-decarboxylase [Desulfobacteraceae bacterium]|jgi:glutamate decarboxylase|nr:putative pyridoxal-dependent aspartate 1-decarboxylase [Desulfobacteraceae bacterium]
MRPPPSASDRTRLVADWQALMRTFLRPDSDAARATLVKYMEQILFGLQDFLKENVGITEERSLRELAARFTETRISPTPEKKLAAVITDLIEEIAPHAVNVASPYFVGHMTSAIPFFMVHLKTIVAALNQNVVKLETSKVVSVVEKQVLAKIHRLIFRRGEEFYRQHVQDTRTTLGSFTEDGTLANLTALWVARNRRFAPRGDFSGIEREGVAAAYAAYGVTRAVVLVSRLGHYSLRKAGGLLGIGNRSVLPLPVDGRNRLDLRALETTLADLDQSAARTAVIAVVGIAGTTETGTVDPLAAIAEVCAARGIHFHVDAAWGGPVLMSEKYRLLLAGIQRADSVTIDGHKQFYMPMSCGMVYFRDPTLMDAIAYHANYVNRPGSLDLGIRTLAGSREASSLILDSTLKIMGTRGYGLLIAHGIETARRFAAEIQRRPLFELVTPPELNILTYRICPPALRHALQNAAPAERRRLVDRLNAITGTVQRLQREAGKSFVSRTTLQLAARPDEKIVVFRCVIMNPMTTPAILGEILDEQAAILRRAFPELDGERTSGGEG